jgi:two-component system chemotaxis response regulator CheB
MTMARRRVVVVEDSAVQRLHLVRTLEADGDLEVVGEAADATEAIDVVHAARPDVVTLDLQIPEGGGQRVIEEVMTSSPTPILVLSGTVGGPESVEAVEALVAGAVDIFPKPAYWDAYAERGLRARVRVVAGVHVIRRMRPQTRPEAPRSPRAVGLTSASPTMVAIGASTGGPAALAQVLADLADLDAAVLVVQHLHADFVNGFVSWMARVCPLHVVIAEAGVVPQRGTVYVAPGGVHLRIGQHDEIVLDTHPELLHRPSVDQLFSSLAARATGRNVGVLLTGMGEDGAVGLLALRHKGAVTIAQDEASSIVFGMPRAAQRLGAASQVVALDEVAARIREAT